MPLHPNSVPKWFHRDGKMRQKGQKKLASRVFEIDTSYLGNGLTTNNEIPQATEGLHPKVKTTANKFEGD